MADVDMQADLCLGVTVGFEQKLSVALRLRQTEKNLFFLKDICVIVWWIPGWCNLNLNVWTSSTACRFDHVFMCHATVTCVWDWVSFLRLYPVLWNAESPAFNKAFTYNQLRALTRADTCCQCIYRRPDPLRGGLWLGFGDWRPVGCSALSAFVGAPCVKMSPTIQNNANSALQGCCSFGLYLFANEASNPLNCEMKPAVRPCTSSHIKSISLSLTSDTSQGLSVLEMASSQIKDHKHHISSLTLLQTWPVCCCSMSKWSF